MQVTEITLSEILQKFDCLFLDVYGVLLDKNGLFNHTAAFIDRLRRENKKFMLVSNGAGRTLENTVSHYNKVGLKVSSEEVITSGSLLKEWVDSHNLAGIKAYAIGNPGSLNLVENSSLKLTQNGDFDVFLVMNQVDNLLEELDTTISLLVKKIDSGSYPKLVLPNPDFLYPKAEGDIGITSGAIANLIESVLKKRYGPNSPIEFIKLGKPYSPIFKKAVERTGAKNPVMIGDQIPTDVLGALNFGITGVLYSGGMTHLDSYQDASLAQKSFHVLKSFS